MSGHNESQSLRFFLNNLEKEELLSLSCPREDYLMSALSLQLESEKKFPVIKMTDPETGKVAVANSFANRDILKKFIHNIDCVETAADSFKDIIYTDYPSVQEIATVGDDVNVLDLPVFRHFEGDAGRYITSAIVIAKDPATGRCNMSFHRMMLKDKNKIGISLHSRGDLYRYFEYARANQKDLEIAAVIGCHPAYHITCASTIPAIWDDYSWAGAYMNQTPEVTRALTVDIPVPAHAEYVLEGKIKWDQFEDEGPFGEYTGYSTSRSTRNIFEVTAITHRHNAIYQDLVPGYAWEHLLLSQFTDEINLLAKLQKEIPEVTGLALPKNGCHFHAYISLKNPSKGLAKRAMMLLFGLDHYLKLIVAVNDDVDIYDDDDVLWAMSTHMQASRDVFIIPDVVCNRLDPSSREGMSDKMGIDATNEEAGAKRVTLPEDVHLKAAKLIRNFEND